MKLYQVNLIFICTFLSIIGWTGNESNNTDCSGSILQHNGETIFMHHIQFGPKSDLEVYSIPAKTATKQELEVTTKTKAGVIRSEILLEGDPLDSERRFKATEIKTIRVPTPNTTWIYQEKNKDTQHKYIEIIINDKHYLAPKDTKIKGIQTEAGADCIIKLRALAQFTARECKVLPTPEEVDKQKRKK